MNGERQRLGPDDESSESLMERMALEDIFGPPDILIPESSLDDVFVPLTEEELAEGHPALETIGTILEYVQVHLQYFLVEGADRITVDQIQQLEPSVYHNPLDLEDLVLLVKDELNQQDIDSPIPSRLTVDLIIDASSRTDIKKRLDEETQKAITNLSIRLFGQEQEEKIFRKAIESPTLARKIRRFSWILNQPYMKKFPDLVRHEIAVRKYEKREAGDETPVSMGFPEVNELAHRALKGLVVEIDNKLANITPSDYLNFLANRMLKDDVLRAIAVCETVALTNL